jgi:methylmalonyl-CoA/ethylmalonyl-CoA epimerase
MPKIKRIDHIAIVVEDLQPALSFWQEALGLNLESVLPVPEQLSEIAFLPAGGSEVELVRPTTTDSGIAKYLQKRGPGIHHICFEVEDLDSALLELKAKGVRLINETAQPGRDGKRLAFIHPESTGGVLVELYELPANEEGHNS